MAEADFDGHLPRVARFDWDWAEPSAAWVAPGRLRSHVFRGALKRGIDIAGALALAVVFAPAMLGVTALLARGGGPVLFPHHRIGYRGRSFRCYKFRSMVTDADQQLEDMLAANPVLRAEWEETRKLRDDPRITRVGRFLRRTSLDELPQLWNVLKGDMSLVGPRPVVHEELSCYGRNLPTYLAAKPGLTGLWQVMGRSDTGYRRRVAMDIYYARRQGMLLDAVILLRTVGVVVAGRGAY
jgi:lipopolysaccharide/colanic/teichoic acid biosynthesis glycosyltransferase